MVHLLIRIVINAIALWVVTQLPVGVHITSNYWTTLIIVAVLFGVVNAIIKPIVTILTCPLVILTLGLFTFIINALMLWLTAQIAKPLGLGFEVDSFFWSAIVGALIISLVSFVLSMFVQGGARTTAS